MREPKARARGIKCIILQINANTVIKNSFWGLEQKDICENATIQKLQKGIKNILENVE